MLLANEDALCSERPFHCYSRSQVIQERDELVIYFLTLPSNHRLDSSVYDKPIRTFPDRRLPNIIALCVPIGALHRRSKIAANQVHTIRERGSVALIFPYRLVQL